MPRICWVLRETLTLMALRHPLFLPPPTLPSPSLPRFLPVPVTLEARDFLPLFRPITQSIPPARFFFFCFYSPWHICLTARIFLFSSLGRVVRRLQRFDRYKVDGADKTSYLSVYLFTVRFISSSRLSLKKSTLICGKYACSEKNVDNIRCVITNTGQGQRCFVCRCDLLSSKVNRLWRLIVEEQEEDREGQPLLFKAQPPSVTGTSRGMVRVRGYVTLSCREQCTSHCHQGARSTFWGLVEGQLGLIVAWLKC